MTPRELASLIAKKEGKKSQARISDIREILSILITIEAEHSVNGGPSSFECLFKMLSKKKIKAE